jgi:alcohol dehydrogenase class IV
MIAIPTTAGTGSEVGRSGVVTLDMNHRKTVIFSPHLLANVAVLDPEMTRTMPAHVTAATGFDALTHCIEAFVARGDHPMADGACHSLAHPLSSECGLHHGLANALCLPSVVEFNAHAAPARLAEVACLLGGETCGDALRAMRTAIGLPESLGAAGVPRAKLGALADLAIQDACHTLNPRTCSRDDLLRLYEAAY